MLRCRLIINVGDSCRRRSLNVFLREALWMVNCIAEEVLGWINLLSALSTSKLIILRYQLLLLFHALRPTSIMPTLLIGKGEVSSCVVVCLALGLL